MPDVLFFCLARKEGRERKLMLWGRGMDGWVYRRTMGELNEEKKKYLVGWLVGWV